MPRRVFWWLLIGGFLLIVLRVIFGDFSLVRHFSEKKRPKIPIRAFSFCSNPLVGPASGCVYSNTSLWESLTSRDQNDDAERFHDVARECRDDTRKTQGKLTLATWTQRVSTQLFATISRLNQNGDFVETTSAKTGWVFLLRQRCPSASCK